MSLRDQIAALPQGRKFTDVMDRLKDADPAEIERVAARWVMAGHDAVGNMNVLAGAVHRVDDWWKGDSADAFVTYMRKYGKAGQALNDVLVSCAGSLNDVADELTQARQDVDKLGGDLLKDVESVRATYARAKNDPQAGQANLDRDIGDKVTSAAASAGRRVDAAETVMSLSLTNINKQLGVDKDLFSEIPLAGKQEFVGDKVGWVPVSPEEFRRTRLAENGGSSGHGGTGATSGSGGTGEYGYIGASSGGTTPRPKDEVVKWIKEALTVIKSPEMAEILRRRGIDVSDLDPNDPKDIERVWTVIFHESGGNPSAVNRWDVNAQNGVPSQGLMQTIPPTFNAHSLPGHKRILEPVDNIIAGVLYTYSRYGDLGRHPGIASLESGGGYRPY
ncbi:transglycosylase SLT domain-containing protein [Nonomuraea lactucae]|uniref:transglycosylase SLT domain-containing protein n=1 Tax=Nonomuraea lactucae TaxID=2249762 RepID=UPI000DE4FC7A|nr:transglycosylase SLT domain-containing protein [Nonomuraea lactucae]